MSATATKTPAVKVNIKPADPFTFEFPIFASKEDRKTWFKLVLETDTWAVWGMTRIFEYQTEDEKQADTTSHDNGVGFSGADAEILSSFAKQFNKYGNLSEKQLAIVKKRMPRYAGQLIAHLEKHNLSMPIDGDAPKASSAPMVLPPAVVPAGAILFGATPEVEPVVSKPAQPDWGVFNTIKKLSYPWTLFHQGAENTAESAEAFKTAVEDHIGKADAFAQDVWKTVSTNKRCSMKQACVLAIACAKVAGGVESAK